MTLRLPHNAPRMPLPARPKLGWTCYSDGEWRWERAGRSYAIDKMNNGYRVCVNGYSRATCDELGEAMFWCATDAADRRIDRENAELIIRAFGEA
jgi:hypothetical protein